MTDPNYTHIAAIVDRSGSMLSCAEDMRGGLNTFFAEQAELPGKCLVDYAQFDNKYELVYEDRPVDEAVAVLEPRSMTALNDAIGKTVTTLGEKLARLDEDDRPGKVMVFIVTDGMENASLEWSPQAVKALIQRQTDRYQWEFIFLAANIDAIGTASTYGISRDSSLNFDTTNVGAMTASLNSYATATRGGGSYQFTEEDRKANS